jgi:hypothetical protein
VAQPILFRVFNETDYREGLVIRHWINARDNAQGNTVLVVVLGNVDKIDSAARSLVESALQRNYEMVAIDAGQILKSNPQLPRPAAGFVFGYNRANLAKDARAIAWALDKIALQQKPSELWVISLDQTTALAAVATAARESKTACTRFFGEKTSFDSVADFEDPRFLPGVLSLGDLEGLIRIIKPRETKLWDLRNSPSIDKIVETVF